MCHSSPEALHEAGLDLLFDLLEQRAKEPLNTAELAELDAARSIIESLKQEWSALPGYVEFPPLEE